LKVIRIHHPLGGRFQWMILRSDMGWRFSLYADTRGHDSSDRALTRTWPRRGTSGPLIADPRTQASRYTSCSWPATWLRWRALDPQWSAAVREDDYRSRRFSKMRATDAAPAIVGGLHAADPDLRLKHQQATHEPCRARIDRFCSTPRGRV